MISPRKSSQVKQGEKEIGERREPSVAWDKKKAGEPVECFLIPILPLIIIL